MCAQTAKRKLPLGVSWELGTRPLVQAEDSSRLAASIRRLRPDWLRALRAGGDGLKRAVEETRFEVLSGEPRGQVLAGRRALAGREVVLQYRLKKTDAIVSKMQRFDEGLAEILDIWGYRLIVPGHDALDEIVDSLTGLWDKPVKADLSLRRGQLLFSPLRDYRDQDHAGISTSTARTYDEAVHLNRRSPFGMVEIQVLTQDLYERAFLSRENEESHVQFRRRRVGRSRGIHVRRG